MTDARSVLPRLLFVEDNADDVMLTRTAVRQTGIAVDLQFIDNGSDAIALLTSGAPLPDITFLDINLPRVSGLDVLRKLRARPADAQPVLIVMTTSTDPHDERVARELGCNDFYVKPLGFMEYTNLMINVMQRWLAPPAVAGQLRGVP